MRGNDYRSYLDISKEKVCDGCLSVLSVLSVLSHSMGIKPRRTFPSTVLGSPPIQNLLGPSTSQFKWALTAEDRLVHFGRNLSRILWYPRAWLWTSHIASLSNQPQSTDNGGGRISAHKLHAVFSDMWGPLNDFWRLGVFTIWREDRVRTFFFPCTQHNTF